ncbi:MAG: ArsR family transcriptional regulator [Verrucomicrobia bacterium]|nr:ArsR family transcriptional regulator [Verrucomicrobiota bacterium]
MVAFEAEVVDFFVDAVEVIGLPKSVAAIYGIIFAAPEPLTFADISNRLDLSKGSISQSLKVLREMGAVKEVSAIGERAARFVPDLELRALVSGFLRSKVLPQLARGSSRLADLESRAKAIRDDDPDKTRSRQERLEKLASWQRKGQTVIPLISKFFG